MLGLETVCSDLLSYFPGHARMTMSAEGRYHHHWASSYNCMALENKKWAQRVKVILWSLGLLLMHSTSHSGYIGGYVPITACYFQHVYRKTNFVADCFASLGMTVSSPLVCFYFLPLSLYLAFHLDRLEKSTSKGFAL